MINSITHGFRNYIDAMPDNTFETVFKSGIYSFTLGALFTGNVQTGLLVGGVATTVSVIHALTVPLFKKISGKNTAEWYLNIAHVFTSLALTQLIVNATTTTIKINLIARAGFTLAINFFMHEFNDVSLNKSSPFLVI